MIGQTLGSYRVVSEIGSGGMGVVYMAEHTMIGRKVAVKLLRADMPKEYVERFFNEAKAAATLHHPGLVDVFDFGHHPDGRAFIVMEYLQGESLAERLEHDPRLPVPIACSIARTVATSLEVAHQGGIVHRDLKPGNIFLIPDPESPVGVRTKVLDFGIAKLVRDREPGGVDTQSGAVIGTPRYMSPEQCKNAKSVDGRSDIYSLGCILYEMLLGVAPFDYDSWAELVGAHIYEEPPRPTEIDPKLPAEVETLVCKMLEKSPEERFQSMQQLAESLEVLLRTHGAAPVRHTPPSRLSAPAIGNRKVPTEDPTMPASSLAHQKRAGTDPTLAPTSATTAERIVAAPPARPARSWLPIGAGVLGLAGLALGAFAVFGKSESTPTEDTTYVVVDQRGSATKPVEVTAPLDAAVAVVEDPTPPPTTADAGVARPPPKTPTETDPALLTASFARQRGAIATCFTQHPTTVEGKISVRFQVNLAGKVKTAEVLPASLAATPAGVCIAAVAKRTDFGPQPKPVTFSASLEKFEQ